MQKSYYLDYNATTPLDERVWSKMEPYARFHYGNPSSLHHQGRVTAKALREARTQIAAILGASDEREVVFTSCGSESNNAAIRSALLTQSGRKQIITSKVEHSSIKKLCRYLPEEGYEVVEIGVSAQGFLNMDEFKRALSERTAIVSLMLANNETGVLFPINEIGECAKAAGALFHVDAVQAVGKHSLDVKNAPIDFLSFSAHKFYGPKGVGGLYIRQDTPFTSWLKGGSQERGRRAGTENVSGIVGMGEAASIALRELPQEIERLLRLRRRFEQSLCDDISGITVNGDINRRLPTTSNLRFPGVDGEAFMMALDQKGVCVSSGSACMSGSPEPSHVLKAMGLTDEESSCSVRFSFGRFTTEEEITAVIAILKDTLKSFKEMDKDLSSLNKKAAH